MRRTRTSSGPEGSAAETVIAAASYRIDPRELMVDRFFKALSGGIRRSIVRLLSLGERSAGEIVASLSGGPLASEDPRGLSG